MEYKSGEFEKFYNDVSINHQLIVAYTLQQNGVLKRKNKIMVEKARCMVFEKNLAKNF